jgi:hypothetical protein
MNLKNYATFFHDGSIIAINHLRDEIIILMESAEVDEEDIKDAIVLSKDDRIRGILHIKGIKNVKEDGRSYNGTVTMKHEDAEIFHFEMAQNKIELQIKWGAYPPKPRIEDFSTIEIEAEKIWWENIPDLPNNCCNEDKTKK